MPLLTGAITALTLAGTPGLATYQGQPPPITSGPRTYSAPFSRLTASGTPGRVELGGTFTKNPSPASGRTYSTDFTRLAPHGTPGQVYGSFVGKTESFEESFPRTDRYVPVLTFEPIDAVTLDVSDSYLPVLGMTALAGQARTPADTYRPRLTESVFSLSKSGNTPKAAVDSYVPVLTFTVAQRDIQSVTDSYVPVLTMSLAASASDAVVLSDSYVLVLNEVVGVDAYLASIQYARSDSYVLTLGMSVQAAAAGEVDIIMLSERAYGYIRVTEI